MAAQPKAPDPDSSDELDAVIDKIDACLPAIHEKAARTIRGAPTPTQGFAPEKARQTKMEFQAMSEDSLLSESREDIHLKDEEKSRTTPIPGRAVLRFRKRA